MKVRFTQHFSVPCYEIELTSYLLSRDENPLGNASRRNASVLLANRRYIQKLAGENKYGQKTQSTYGPLDCPSLSLFLV